MADLGATAVIGTVERDICEIVRGWPLCSFDGTVHTITTHCQLPNGSLNDKGVTGTGGVIAAIAFIPVAGFLTTGTSATVPLGAAVTGFVGEDIPVVMAAASTTAPLTAQPMIAPAATVTSAPPAVVLTPAAATTEPR